jgi:hypothetical protein
VNLFGGKSRHQGDFGSCCKDLHTALAEVPKSLFHVSPEGTLFLSVGMAETEDGVGWFDQAVIFCPFCGKRLQDKNEIGKKVRDAASGSVH